MRSRVLPAITEADLYWLAGLLEGEGSFLKPTPSSPASPIVVVSMTDLDVIERAAMIIGSGVWKNQNLNPKWKQTYRATIKGQRAVDLMKLLYPHMGQRRREQIDAAIDAREKRYNPPVPPDRLRRNLEIAGRLAAGESGVALAQEFEMTHQNVYYIGNRYKSLAV